MFVSSIIGPPAGLNRQLVPYFLEIYLKFKMKYFVALLLIAALVAADKAEEERPKTYRRLIPADVLRGKWT